MNELAKNSKYRSATDLYRWLNEYKKDYQLSTNLVKDENADLLAESHDISNM
jgi:hypothetical protein